MSTKTKEIQAALSGLSTRELYLIERSIHEMYRKRNENILYDDAYGVWTEEDQSSAAAEAFAIISDQEKAEKDDNS